MKRLLVLLSSGILLSACQQQPPTPKFPEEFSPAPHFYHNCKQAFESRKRGDYETFATSTCYVSLIEASQAGLAAGSLPIPTHPLQQMCVESLQKEQDKVFASVYADHERFPLYAVWRQLRNEGYRINAVKPDTYGIVRNYPSLPEIYEDCEEAIEKANENNPYGFMLSRCAFQVQAVYEVASMSERYIDRLEEITSDIDDCNPEARQLLATLYKHGCWSERLLDDDDNKYERFYELISDFLERYEDTIELYENQPPYVFPYMYSALQRSCELPDED
jgi:hypothetical protein